MVRKAYNNSTFIKDEEFLQYIHDSGIPISNITDNYIGLGRDILASRYKVIYGQGGKPISPYDAPDSQVRVVLQKEYLAAKKRVKKWEQSHTPLPSAEKPLEARLLAAPHQASIKDRVQSLFGNDIERLLGDDAEEQGGCGCTPLYRILDLPP